MRRRTVLAVVTAFAVLLGVGAYAVGRRIGDVQLRMPVGSACQIGAGPDRVELDPEQVANAATISAVAIRRSLPRRAVVVALATALQESSLQNLAGGDRDSIGLFQQRPSQGWGRPEQLSDPRYAAGRFYTALLKVRGWQEMRVTDAAQAVQRSAYPQAYERWTERSEVLASALLGEAAGTVGCTVGGEPPQRGSAAADALLKGFTLDWGEVHGTVQPTGLSVTVSNDVSGWQYAHWLVAHATGQGVRRVRFGGREWRAEAGTWDESGASPDPGAAGTVQAEIHR